MHLEQYLPTSQLQPYVKNYLIVNSDQEMANKLLPDTSIVIAFRLKGSVTYTEEGIKNNMPVSVVSGIRTSSRVVDYSKNTANLLIIFREGGAGVFFREPLHELNGISMGLCDLIDAGTVRDIEDQLAEATDNHQRINIAERFLLSRLQQKNTDLLIQEAIQKIRLCNGNIRISDLIAQFPISRDPFEKRFRRVTGTSPKQFSVIVRLKHVIDHYSGSVNLTKTAHAAGYFDQAHFIKDFKVFTGQTPHEFFKTPPLW